MTREQIIGLDNPWPLKDVLNVLIEASESLLHRYNYDKHNHEEIGICIKRGKGIISELCSEPETDKTAEKIKERYASITKDVCEGYQHEHILQAMEEYARQRNEPTLSQPNDEEIETWANNELLHYKIGLSDGAKAMRDGKIGKNIT